MACTTCELDSGLERVRYFSRQLIGAEDMTAEQRYFRERLRRHNRFAHGWGVVCGCDVKPDPKPQHPWRVRVCPGYVLGPHGDEIAIGDDVYYDLDTGQSEGIDPCVTSWPCPPSGTQPYPGRSEPVFLAVRYAECNARPQQVSALGCGCDDRSCEYSRTRDAFELTVLWDLPESHKQAALADKAWAQTLIEANRGEGPPPVPPCPECADSPWVVLARIKLPAAKGDALHAQAIDFKGRRVLYSTAALQVEAALTP
jgi:hypothetical protein